MVLLIVAKGIQDEHQIMENEAEKAKLQTLLLEALTESESRSSTQGKFARRNDKTTETTS